MTSTADIGDSDENTICDDDSDPSCDSGDSSGLCSVEGPLSLRISWNSARVGAGLMKGFDTEELESSDSTNAVGADLAGFACLGVSLACGSVSSTRLGFIARVVELGILTRGCLGGGASGSPTRHSSVSSPGETVGGERVGVVLSETEANRTFVLSSCSSSVSRLGAISRFPRLLVLPPAGMTGGDRQEKDDKDDVRGLFQFK